MLHLPLNVSIHSKIQLTMDNIAVVTLTMMITTTLATTTPLYIGAFYPLTRDNSEWGQGCLPAAELAVMHINNRSDILPNYTLHLQNMDTKGSPGVATRELFKMLASPPKKICILGPFPSNVAISVAQTAQWWHLVQVSPAAFSPELSDRVLFPYFFRTRAALTSFNSARIAFLQTFGWKKIAIITRQINYFIATVDEMYADFKAANITVLATEVYQNDAMPVEELTRIKGLNARIIFVLAYEEYARKIFCQAIQLGMIGKKYVYILHYGNDPLWMEKPTQDGACSASQLTEAAMGHFIISDVTLRLDNVMPEAGIAVDTIMDEYRQLCAQMKVNRAEFYAPLTYDAVWSLALALNASQHQMALENFTYENTNMTNIIMSAMSSNRFEGMSGTIKFTDDGNIATLKTRISRYNGSFLTLGYHSATTNLLSWTTKVSWDGHVPYDDYVLLKSEVTVSQGLFYAITILAIAGILLSISFFTFNITQRNTKLIRMSSPALNNVVVAGCILAYVSVILYGLMPVTSGYSTYRLVCHVRMIFLAVGFSMGFGALFAKTWRVFKIFTSNSAKKMMISDSRLLTMVSVFVAIDILFFTLWFTLDVILVVETKGPIISDGDDILRQYTVSECRSPHDEVYLVVLYVIKGILLVFGVFLAWQTRAVTIPALNDSKYIGVAVYNVTMTCIIGCPVTFIIESDKADARFALTSACILFCTTFGQCIVFLPKIFNMKNSVAATQNTIFQSHLPQSQLQPRSDDDSATGSHDQSRSVQPAANKNEYCPHCNGVIRGIKIKQTSNNLTVQELVK